MGSNSNTPGNPEVDQFYDAAPLEPHLIYQGEILIDVPVLRFPKETRWLMVRTGSGRTIHDALQNGRLGGTVKVLDSNQTQVAWDAATNEGDYAIGRLTKHPVLVLSQNCDIANKNFIQVAPIFVVGNDAGAEYAERLRNGQIFSAFWLKDHDAAPRMLESYADLELIQAVHKSYIKRLTPEQHFRLAPPHVRKLQQSLTRYFGRPNMFDADADRVPRDGTYLCVWCFYIEGQVSACEKREGERFEHCPRCGKESWVKRER